MRGVSSLKSKSNSSKLIKSATINQNEDVDDNNWKNKAFVCGSNAFGQLNIESFELFCSTLRPINFNNTSDKIIPRSIDSVCCGSNTSITLCNSSTNINHILGYIWGEGFTTQQYRIPTRISNITSIYQVSCGQTHAGLITMDGKLYTWGNGENGMLGHNSKQSINSPKLVESLSSVICLNISCGAFHSAVICSSKEDVQYVEIARDDSVVSLRFGQLYTCGQTKAGQLGLGKPNNNSHQISKFTQVSYLSDEGYLCGKVSCGFHHTLVIVTPILKSTHIESPTKIFSFGWGEYGRLGLGDDEIRYIPTEVKFPDVFSPFDIAAGEQHSLAAGRYYCYSWGSNSMGQLGIGNPSTYEFTLIPTQIALPDSISVTSVSAGGRHSAAISSCRKLLTWGWGEEGQLGHSTEKSCYLPRPVRIPRYKDIIGYPTKVSLGMSHTIVIIENPNYIEKIPDLPIVSNKIDNLEENVSPPVAPPIAEKFKDILIDLSIKDSQPVVNTIDEEPIVVPVEIPVEITYEEPNDVNRSAKPGLFITDKDDDFSISPVRSVKGLLNLRKSSKSETDDNSESASTVESNSNLEIVDQVVDTVMLNIVEDNDIHASDDISKNISPKIMQNNVINHDRGLELHTARRAELRKQKNQNNSKTT